MSPIFLLFSLAVVFHCSPANAQPVKWEPLTEQQEHDLKLEHGAHLLEVAAPFKSFITVDQTRPQQTVVVQEYVTVQFNCLSWLNRFERGTARWLIQHLFADQTPRTCKKLLCFCVVKSFCKLKMEQELKWDLLQ